MKQVTAFGLGPFAFHYVETASGEGGAVIGGEEVETGAIRLVSSLQKTAIFDYSHLEEKAPITLKAKGALFELIVPLSEAKGATYTLTPDLTILAYSESPLLPNEARFEETVLATLQAIGEELEGLTERVAALEESPSPSP